MVKAQFATRVRQEDTLERLESEKRRIERTIESLGARLAEIERRIGELRQ
jgi:prefoldin subunit 5